MTGSECPIEGCRKPFDSPNALANHIFRSQGDGHGDYDNWDKADELARETWGESTPTEGGKSGDGEDPTLGSTEPEPVENEPDEPTCPKCGGTNLFVPAQVPGVNPDHAAAGYDYGCKDCSTTEKWEVFNA